MSCHGVGLLLYTVLKLSSSGDWICYQWLTWDMIPLQRVDFLLHDCNISIV